MRPSNGVVEVLALAVRLSMSIGMLEMMVSASIAEAGFEPRVGRSVSLVHAAALLRVSRRTIYHRIRDL
jgi:hypothetical protein